MREDLPLTKAQIGHTIITSVAITIVARLAFGLTRTQFLWNRHCERSAAISLGQGMLRRERDRHVASLLAMTNWVRVRVFGWLCDRVRPHLAYSELLVVGSIRVGCIGLANSYETILRVPAGHRRHRRVLHNHALSRLGLVHAERRGSSQRTHRRLGQPGRRSDANRGAAGLRGRAYVRRWRSVRLAHCHGVTGRGVASGGHRLVLPDARFTGGHKGLRALGMMRSVADTRGAFRETARDYRDGRCLLTAGRWGRSQGSWAREQGLFKVGCGTVQMLLRVELRGVVLGR